jgi:predicted acyltransferase
MPTFSAASPSVYNLDVPPASSSSPQARLISLDVFRGLTIAFMALVNIQPDPKYVPLEHADWHGWTPTDLVFPFFLFIVGVAIPFSFAKRLSQPGASRKSVLGHIWLRALSLFMLGWIIHSMPGAWRTMPEQGFYALKILRVISVVFTYASLVALLIPWKWKRVQIWLPIGVAISFVLLIVINHFALAHAKPWLPEKFGWGTGLLNPDRIRIPGVLQRIGICYGVAATLSLFTGWRTMLVAAILLMASYSALMLRAPFPNHVTGSLTKSDNLDRSINETVFDRYTIGEDGKRIYTQRHTYADYPDPEGLLSTIPAIATPLLGVIVGFWLRSTRPAIERCAALFAFGFVTTLLGCGLDWWLMPINKKIWTPSFVVLTAGLGMLTLALLLWVIDIQGWRKWSWPWAVMGMNAIVIYALSELFDYFMAFIPVHFRGDKTNPLGALEMYYRSLEYHGWHLAPQNASLLYALTYVAVMLVAAIVLYLCRIFVRI